MNIMQEIKDLDMLENPNHIPIHMIKNNEVLFEDNAKDELLKLLEVSKTVQEISGKVSGFFGEKKPEILEVVLTPDFHKGSGIPIGTVMLTHGFMIPQAIGNDVNCGMRLYTTDIHEEKLLSNLPKLQKQLRHVFFEGGRSIPMTRVQREAVFREGLMGILETYDLAGGNGLWKYYKAFNQGKDITNVENFGSLITNKIVGLGNFLGREELTYDDQIGSIGGGNHFVEIQKVTKVYDAQTAYAWNLKEGQIVVMIHAGSVMMGHHTGIYVRETLKGMYPKGLRYSDNGIFVLPESEKYKEEMSLVWASICNSANFAFANRMFLGLMVYKTMVECLGDLNYNLLYDAPHNMVWKERIDGKDCYLHRKGACPARGMNQMTGSKFEYHGEPVLIPGSMGASSYILCGLGNRTSLFSASHGAGRSLSRGQALRYNHSEFQRSLEKINVITPIDPDDWNIKGRPDLLKKWEEDLKKEAPFAYKEIGPIIKAHVDNNVASIVAKVEPILTIKG